VEHFRRYTDEQLLRRLEDVGGSAMLDELRENEQGDDQPLALPRFKIHDDASALWGQIAE
ncbi:protein phosphatase 2C domain-containing protein, partial [Pseudomonas aeruginosa]|nr:protein phosphatase 2C domain-containing protein [Pseudomonas aeruginosa]